MTRFPSCTPFYAGGGDFERQASFTDLIICRCFWTGIIEARTVTSSVAEYAVLDQKGEFNLQLSKWRGRFLFSQPNGYPLLPDGTI
jgi:hypothetical protein